MNRQGGEWIIKDQELDLEPLPPPGGVGYGGHPAAAGYETGGMLQEFVWQKTAGEGPSSMVDENQIQPSFRWSQKQQMSVGVVNGVSEELHFMNHHQIKDSSSSSSSYLHHLVQNSADPQFQGHHLIGAPAQPNIAGPSQFGWSGRIYDDGGGDGMRTGRVLEGQGLSLSLSSSLRNMETSKLQKMNMEQGELYFRSQGIGLSNYSFANFLRNSRYLRPAQELLQEFCCVGRGQFKNLRLKSHERNPNSASGSGGGGGASSQTPPAKERHSLSPSERTEYQRRKIKLLSMLDEVEERYMRYCEQMQALVNWFDSVVGRGAAAPYTALAQKAMSRHFRCMKDAIAAELKSACQLLGEKDVAGSRGLTKGETPRLKMLEQRYRQQKSLQQMAVLDPESWRPQRGLPERSVNILRSWLFEHFLHPVRLWKPMVEEMYQQELHEVQQQSAAPGDSAQNPNAPPPLPSNIIINAAATENDLSEGGGSAPAAYGEMSRCYPPPEQMGDGARNRPAGEVSLTLELRHSENLPNMRHLSIRDFEAY